IAFPDAQNYAEHAFQLRRLQQAFATCGMGLGPKLRASNFEPPTSYMGQSLHFCDVRVMSLSPQQRLLSGHRVRSVQGQQQTFAGTVLRSK
ncbi:MAG: hypothetical protein WBG15_05930, partial [Xanthobacteraceae bacterium]